MVSKLLTLAALLGSAAAMCPGDSPCSGHGSCGTFDRCTCYRNWQGKDCSERVCPYVTSWNELDDDATAVKHTYTECGSKGICDRKAGECKCFDGFTGVGCRRMSCDDDCSGHGTCETIADVWTSTQYSAWDASMITKCVCDPGYEGVNCASRKCKKGDDPMTLTVTDSGSTSSNFQTDTIVSITGASCATASEFAITYTDWRGESWTTWSLDAVDGTAISVEEALLALPNEAIPTVTVAGGLASDGTITITFSDSLNSGPQTGVSLLQTTCTDGCQPRIAIGSGTCLTLTTTTLGTEEWNTCSDRGACNADTGDCECYDGFTGQACEIQTIIT